MKQTFLMLALSTAGLTAGAELILPDTALERTEPVIAIYRTNPQANGKGRLTIHWTDVLGRVVEDHSIPVDMLDETEIRFPLDIRRAVVMQNQVRVHLSLEGVDKKGNPDHREEDAEVSFIAKPPEREWYDYNIIMWQHHPAELFAKLKTLGINGGQYLGRNLKPPDFLLANNLRWYAENIATDYYSEYHRYRRDRIQNWSWLQAKELYRKDPDSKEAFKRHPSFSDPSWRKLIHDRLVEAARVQSPYRPFFYDLGDESGIADLAGYWDFDFSDYALGEMRQWLKKRYGLLSALNAQWGSHFPSWESVFPETTREAMKRTDDNYSSWADHKEWMDISYANALKMGVDAVRSVDPDAYVGIAGGQMPGWGGYDYYRLSQVLTAVEPYDIGNNIEILRSINPKIPVVTTAFARGPWEKHRIWYELLHGARGNIIWDEKSEFVSKDGTIGARGQEVEPYYNEIRNGIGALLINSTRKADPIAIHYSQPSMRTEWMLAERGKGEAWVDRTSSTERTDSEFLRLRESYCKLIEDLGLQYRFVAYGQVEAGELLKRGYRVLILPRSSALSNAEADAIRAFTEQGGLVIADGDIGTFDEHTRRRAQPALSDLFNGESGRGKVVKFSAMPYYQQRLMNKEAGLRDAMAALLSANGIRPEFAVVDESNRPVVGIETHAFQNGGITVVGLLSNPQLRVDELGPPEFRSNERFEKPQSIRLTLADELYVYDVRGAKSLGRQKQLSITTDPYEPAVYAFSPTPLPQLRVSSPARVERGTSGRIGLTFAAASPAAVHIFHVEVADPAAKTVDYYTRNVIAPGGNAGLLLPFAKNDAAGKWTVRVHDLISGQRESATIDLF